MKKTRADRKDDRRSMYVVCILIMVAVSVILPVMLKTNTQVQYRTIYSGYTAGEIAEKSVYAKSSIDLIDYDATQESISAARKAVLPVFSYSQVLSSETLAKADRIRHSVSAGDYSVLEGLVSPDMAMSLVAMKDSTVYAVMYNIITDILSNGYYRASDIESVRAQGYDNITLSNMFTSDSTGYEKIVELVDESLITSTNIDRYILERLSLALPVLTARELNSLENLIAALVSPNIIYDEALTSQRRSSAASDVDTVVISVQKGDVLIEADHVVTHDQVELLRLLSTQSNSLTAIEIAGHVVFDTFIIIVGFYVFGMFLGRGNLHFKTYNILLCVGFVLSVLATYFLTLVSSGLNLEFSDSFLPVFFLPLFITEITGYKRLGFVSSFMFAAVLATLPTSSIMTFFYCFICGGCCVFLIRFFNRRIDMIYQWFFSCIACSAISIVFIIITQVSFSTIFVVLLGTLLNVSIAYILLSLAIPVAERLLNLPTIFRLSELAYGGSPILTRLYQSAPGTYTHSMAVADLAETGAKAIGANALLARVGGMYHDIGKTEHPEYFVENQENGVNKHDDISPSLSVAVIKSHVKVGADKGREAGLPTEVVKIIANHHGNDVIQYFYHEALKLQAASGKDRGETVNPGDFSYNADIPDSRECAIVMLADSVEAASRTLVAPNAAKYAKLIDSIFMNRIEHGQLDDSNLTMNDIRELKDSFVKSLVARNHSRIEYPDED